MPKFTTKMAITSQIVEFSAFVDVAIHNESLTGTSSPPPVARNRLNAFRNMIADAQTLFANCRIEESHKQLLAALQKCNGEHIDFVQGSARAEVEIQITNLIAAFASEIERDHAYGGLKAAGHIS